MAKADTPKVISGCAAGQGMCTYEANTLLKRRYWCFQKKWALQDQGMGTFKSNELRRNRALVRPKRTIASGQFDVFTQRMGTHLIL